MSTIGVQMMMLKEQVEQTGPREVLRRLHELGFRSVEVSQIPMTPENVDQMRRAGDDFGIVFGALSAGVGPGPNDSLLDAADKVIADARALGAERVRIGMMPLAAFTSHEALVAASRQAEKAARRLAEEGITLSYHNHHVEFARRGGITLLDTIRAEAPTLKLEIDVHWVQRGGKDPVRTLTELTGRVDLVHLKDYRVAAPTPEVLEQVSSGGPEAFQRAFTDLVQFAEVGEGSLDWVEVVPAALDAGAKHLFIEQDVQYGRDPFDCLRTSRDNLVELGFGHLI
ncbi:Sugar phosphate isomerase/epimerase [Quadrisphaera granulorum]|uniref:Sugar phosphate isomerase/epimerase n=1 Tax=Quadrisphaera granulorum TaxID=317664 RepID=A0A316A9J1_9ACTN|nr:sugar phosphate isomerase/epimerase [Quadrisphaera granulorum]PWJ54425.1 sugar phosphate isomerase/epimerase [Quadrisphaera granulorum]SZE96197.1 Sugar phosphate isomerase/epimerase [Quadrisphaera granulorum]